MLDGRRALEDFSRRSHDAVDAAPRLPAPLATISQDIKRERAQTERHMLSSTADNLYWLARYMERADFLARAIEASRRLAALPKAYGGADTRMGERAALLGRG